MIVYIIHRLILAIIIIILVTVLIFFVMRLLPGDPIQLFLAQSQIYETEVLEELRHQFGLDKPLIVQYFNWAQGIFRGDFGRSIYYQMNISELMKDRYPITLHLGLLAFVFSNILGILFGLTAALRRGKWIDTIVTVLANIGVCVPVFWLGILLIYGFGLKLGWLPMIGYVSPLDDFWSSTKHVIMPVMCLSIFGLASTTRQMRSSTLEVIQQDYIRTAWAKGLKERLIVTRHVLKNSLIPVITLIGVGVGHIFGGSVIIETVFAIPGIGRLMVTSLFQHDYVVVQSGTLIIAVIMIFANLIVDISYGWLDPRIRYR